MEMTKSGRISFLASAEQGLLGVLDTGLPVFLVNLTGGLFPAIVAGIYQSALTFVMVFINTVIFQFFFHRNHRLLSVIVPVTLSTAMALIMHIGVRSPNPVLSALVVFLMAVWYFIFLAYLSDRFGTISVIQLGRIFFSWIRKHSFFSQTDGFFKIKRYEFWSPRIFNIPFYTYVGLKCLAAGLHPKDLPKADYALDNGDLRASKFKIQKLIGLDKYPPTLFLSHPSPIPAKKRQVMEFADEHDFPIIGKPDIGECGKAVKFIRHERDLDRFLAVIESNYLIQSYIDLPYEYGVFYVRWRNRSRIIGINGKHFPHVIGNGQDCIQAIIEKMPNYSHHWQNFMGDVDLKYVPAKGEYIRLSHIGSHTMGCVFTDETDLVTGKLENRIFSLLDGVSGINFSRLDVRAKDRQSFQSGDFKLIEINGISSLPTQMFEPSYSVWDAYRIFFDTGDWLVRIAKENRHQHMNSTGLWVLYRQIRKDGEILERTHHRLLAL